MSLNFAVDFNKHSLTGFVEHTMKVGSLEETENKVNKNKQKEKDSGTSKGDKAISEVVNKTKEAKPVKFVVLDYQGIEIEKVELIENNNPEDSNEAFLLNAQEKVLQAL